MWEERTVWGGEGLNGMFVSCVYPQSRTVRSSYRNVSNITNPIISYLILSDSNS